jgi:DNA-binding transcriptional MocR family regulator
VHHAHCTATPTGSKRKVFFAALPHDLVADTRLTHTDKVLVALILKYARDKDHAWPSNRRLAAELGRSVRTVQGCLVRLKSTGWIGTRPAANRTGRVLILAWCRADFRTPGVQPVAPPPPQPVAPAPLEILVDRRQKRGHFCAHGAPPPLDHLLDATEKRNPYSRL